PVRAPRARTARSRAGSRRPRSGHSRLGRVLSVIALALAGLLIWFLVALFEPFGTSPHGRVTVIVPAHATSSQIGDLLARDGVVASSFFFQLRATLSGQRSGLRAGLYHLERGMSYGAVLAKLTTAPPAAKVTDLTIAEGRRRAQISALLHAQHVPGNYLAATRSSPLLNLRSYGLHHRPASLEGFLFPDTYQLIDPVKVSALVSDQLKTFKTQFGHVNLSYARRKRLTPYEVLKIASLIEAETPTTHDRPLVASVIYNRLANGMLLGLDSTTQYATGNFTRPLTVSQLHSASPYNTRTHPGLPPTPIDNPGLASIQAAAHPARTRYLYFFATPCRRNSVFATSYSQFLALGRKYQSRHC
ncbi:MAG: endolytic transglycosylase MltG, partial [Actinomycetota bacterium]|nr:endolytic transglycosylase MltG [Actinomycetota bacterium]